MKRLLIGTALALALLGSTGTASAHRLTVDPAAEGSGAVVDQPVSTSWAQAHCHAAAPAEATANSGGVVTFTPAEVLPCPTGPGEGAPGR